MIQRVLVANRGEIAVRVIRAAHDLGVEAVAVVPSADPDAPHAADADAVVTVDAPTPRGAYLDGAALVAAALDGGCDSVHPGYGFLSESSAFARRCHQGGLVFVGPPPEAMDLSGDKIAARGAMRRAGVPVVPGSEGAVEDADQAVAIGETVGYPLLCKAAAGGGGRGIRVVETPAAMPSTFREASDEARISFGSGALYLERYLPRVRHVEVQVLADRLGHVVHLGERECSIQRRHQKLLEEAPSVALTDVQRQELLRAALTAAKACGYVNAGTVEFVVDVDGAGIYFIEMNARIQVEHPVTEMVTGIDLVVEQLRIAAGLPLSINQDDVVVRGHAIECRITAESPEENFLPSPGRVSRYRLPGGPGVRVDGYLESGGVVQPFYDSLIAKVIVHGDDRATALARLRRALRELTIEGIATTTQFHRRLVEHPAFVAGDITTGFVRA